MSRRLLALAVVAAAAGCTPGPPTVCPAVYAPRGVVFHLDPAGTGWAPTGSAPTGSAPTGPVVRLRACMDEECTTTDRTAAVGVPFIVAGAARADSPRAVTARLTVTDARTGAVTLDTSTAVTLRRITAAPCPPDGPGHDRTDGYQATVRLAADGTLRPG